MEGEQNNIQGQEEFLTKINEICNKSSITYYDILKLIKKAAPLYENNMQLLLYEDIDKLKNIRGIIDESYLF